MARQMFTGNYGAPLAQVDTRPILAAGQAWGQAFQNLGQVASDVLEKHRQKKERAKLEPIAEKFAQQALGGQAPADEVEAYKKGLLTPDGMKLLSGMQQMQAQQQQMQAQKQQMDFFQTVKDFKAQQEENQANRIGLLNKLSQQTFESEEAQAKWNEAIQAAFPANEVAALQRRQAEAQAVALEQANELNARKMEIQNEIDKAVDPVEVAKLEKELLELNRDQALANITGTETRTKALELTNQLNSRKMEIQNKIDEAVDPVEQAKLQAELAQVELDIARANVSGIQARTKATKAQTAAVEHETETKKKTQELYPLAEQIKDEKEEKKVRRDYTKAMTEGATATTAEKKRIAEVRKARNFVQVDSNGNVSVKQGGKDIAPDVLEDAIFEKEKRWHEMRLKKLQQEGIQATTKGKQVYANYQNWLMTEGNARKVPTTEFERHLQTIPKSEWPALIRARMQYMTEKGKGPEDQLKLLGVMEAAPTIPVALAARQYRRAMSGDEQETLTAKIVDEKTEGIYKGIGGKKTGRKVLKFKAATDTNTTEWVEVPLTELMIQDLKRYNKLEDEVLGRTPADETPTPKPTPTPTPTPTQFNKEEAISNMRNYFNQ